MQTETSAFAAVLPFCLVTSGDYDCSSEGRGGGGTPSESSVFATVLLFATWFYFRGPPRPQPCSGLCSTHPAGGSLLTFGPASQKSFTLETVFSHTRRGHIFFVAETSRVGPKWPKDRAAGDLRRMKSFPRNPSRNNTTLSKIKKHLTVARGIPPLLSAAATFTTATSCTCFNSIFASKANAPQNLSWQPKSLHALNSEVEGLDTLILGCQTRIAPRHWLQFSG